jgi:anti-sigma factor RsiW
MEHEQIVEKLSEYRDGALGAAERETISRHLPECAECSAVLSDWERLSKAFLRRPPAPNAFQTEAFTARVMARLPSCAQEQFPWLTARWLVPTIGLSFAVLALSFRPYGGAQTLDPASALLLARADRGTISPAGPETRAADVLGLGTEDR